MPIPDKPYTRREAYLNAAATGDSSGIPETPYTREEMYLDAIAKGGGGGGGGGGGSSTLSGLTDVDISNPANGQTLVYNAESGKWENGAGGGVGFTVVNGTIDPDTDDYIIPNMTIGDFLELTQPVLVHVSDVGYDAYAFTMGIMKMENNQANIHIQTIGGFMECSGPMDTPLVFTMPY